MSDRFSAHSAGLDAPASFAAQITPDDSADLSNSTRGIYVGTSGDLTVTLVNGTGPVTFIGMVGGVTHALRVKRVHETGTTATDLVGVW